MPARFKTAGRFGWNPESFDVAKTHVRMARRMTGSIGYELGRRIPEAISLLGALPCPPPPSDPNGHYRVALDESGRPQIQRQQGGDWVDL